MSLVMVAEVLPLLLLGLLPISLVSRCCGGIADVGSAIVVDFRAVTRSCHFLACLKSLRSSFLPFSMKDPQKHSDHPSPDHCSVDYMASRRLAFLVTGRSVYSSRCWLSVLAGVFAPVSPLPPAFSSAGDDRLFSPADTHRMYLEGELVTVHPNGRINYRGKETLADGSDPLAETAAQAAELVDRAAKKAEV